MDFQLFKIIWLIFFYIKSKINFIKKKKMTQFLLHIIYLNQIFIEELCPFKYFYL